MMRPTASPSPMPLALGVAGGVVDPAGIGPEAELALGHVAGDALRGRADQGQLEVVDGPRAVEGQVAQQPALDQIGQQRAGALPEHVRPAHEDHRPAVALRPRRSGRPASAATRARRVAAGRPGR